MATAPEVRIRMERLDPEILRIVLARPQACNAQDPQMLYELNHAFDVAARMTPSK